MPSALARKPEESRSHAAPEPKQEPELSAEAETGAPAGTPLFLRRWAGGPPPVQREEAPEETLAEDEEIEEEPVVQTKLEVNEPGDVWEQEADQVAETAVQGPGSVRAGVTAFPGSSVQRKCAACASSGEKCPKCAEEEEERTAEAPAVQTKRRPGRSGLRAVPASAVQPPGPGEPLQDGVRERVEPILGADLGQVRVHEGPAAHRQAADLGARAFTVGQDVWLGEGESSGDIGLMAHELTHVAQQRPGKVLRPPAGSGAGAVAPVPAPPRAVPGGRPGVPGGGPGAVLEELASASPSQLATAVSQARTASDQEFTSEREDLAANPPSVPRPSGLPRRAPGGEAPEPVEGAAPPEPESVEPETVAPMELETTHVASEAPLPAEGLWETLFRGGDDASLRTAARTTVQSLPTDDPTIDTSAGERPTVELVGEADPGLMTGEMSAQRAAADQSWIEARGEATADYGEYGIFPEVPEEILSATMTLSEGSAGRRREAAQAETAFEVAEAFDRGAAGRWQEEMAAARGEHVLAEQQRAMDEETEHGRAAAEIARLESEATGEQTAAQTRVQEEVGLARTSWTEELTRADLAYTAESERLSTETRLDIEAEQESTDRSARETLEEAEAEAEAKAAEANEEAEAKAAEAEAAEEDSGGFLDWVGSAISSFIDGIRSAINAIFDALRAAVAWIIEQAKTAAIGIIELGRQAIVGMIHAFGTLLEGAAGIFLAAFPEARRRAQERIRAAVSSAEEAVNEVADALKAGVTAALDALGAALDFILEAYQKAYNLILDGIQALADLFLGLLEKIGNLVAAARQVPDHFEGQIQEELIGADLSKPLPFERTGPPTPLEAMASAMTPEGEPVPAGDLAIREIAVDPVATLDLDPEFLATLDLQEGEEVDFGQNADPANTLASLRDEALGLPPAGEESGETAPEGGAPAEEGSAQPAEDDTEARLQELMAAEPEGACNQEAPASEEGGGVPEELKLGPLTQGQRARYLLSQMWKGIRQWWSCNWPTIVAATVAALLGIILLEIVTGGAVTAALPVILQILAMVMIGVAVVRAGSYVGEYLHKGWEGDIDGGGKSLARALAIGAVELIFAILFALTGGAVAALKAGAKAAMKLAGRGARAIGRGALAVGRGVAAGGRAVARGAGRIARPVIQRGRAVMQGLSRGVAKGARSLDDLARRIGERLRFRGLKIKRRGRWVELWGIINPEYLIATIPVDQVDEALEAQQRAAGLKQIIKKEGPAGSAKRTVAAVPGTGRPWSASGFGEDLERLFEWVQNSGRPELQGLLRSSEATEEVIRRTQKAAAQFGDDIPYLKELVKDANDLRYFSAHGERQLALLHREARALGVSQNLCHDCPHFFSAVAQIRGKNLVIADLENVFVFLGNGTYRSVPRLDPGGVARTAEDILAELRTLAP